MNRLYYGDNLDILRNHIDDESVDLIYIDPPFNSNRNYNMIWDEASAQVEAFKDTWSLHSIADEESLIFEKEPQRYSVLHDALTAFKTLLIHRNKALYAYLVNIGIRLVEMYRVLKKTGSFYLHCDPTAGHYLKILLDMIFGQKNFHNEIVWRRTGSHNSAKRNGAIHDTIYFYSKTQDFTWNKVYLPYLKGHVDTYFKKSDERGRYWSNALTGKGITQKGDSGKPWRGFDPTAKGRHWAIPKNIVKELGIEELPLLERLEAMYEEGYIVLPKSKNGMPEYRQYLHMSKGMLLQDIWAHQPHTKGMVNNSDRCIDEDVKWLPKRSAGDRLGLETQKPQGLLERILKASSKEGDVVLDAYCGCGTTVAAAQKLDRRWIGIDITYLAVELIKHRLIDRYYLEKCGGDFKKASQSFKDEVEVFGIPKDFEGAKALATKTKGDRVRKEFEKWAVFTFGGIYFEKKGADGGIDGYFYIVDADKNGKADTRVKAYIQVKSGKVDVSDIRDFSHVLERERANMGVFITIKPPTKPMLDEVAQMPKYRNKLTGLEYDRIHLVTVDDLLEGNLPNLPMTRGTKQAQANRDDTKTEDLLG